VGGEGIQVYVPLNVAYSVRAKERPTVSTPVTWDEIETAVDRADPKLLVFEIDDVLERVAEHGDLFAAVLSTRQRLAPP
jgi:bifunctional non-homologous end joining protein LigD